MYLKVHKTISVSGLNENLCDAGTRRYLKSPGWVREMANGALKNIVI